MTVSDQVSAALAGRYRVDRELGRGGMATVYLAHDLRHDRPVAIKTLHAELWAQVSAERFLREIRVTAQLTHPQILPLLDFGVARRDGAAVLRDAVCRGRNAAREAQARGPAHTP
jgi:serine/threonine-protein kinase